MVVVPKIRGFICTTAHPIGCAEHVKQQIAVVKQNGTFQGPKKVLVLGGSTGYGLSSRIAAAFGAGAATLAVSFERPSNGKRPASAGFYNNVAFDTLAAEEGLYAKTILGDAFSKEIKQQVVDTIKEDLGKVDLVIYSLATPRRTLADGSSVSSVLKTVGAPYQNKTINLADRTVSDVTIEPANDQEIADTIKVMGGEDWTEWMQLLADNDVLANGATTLAYSYIGPTMTHAIYRDGTIGQAKKHLHQTANELTQRFSDLDLHAYISVNKALVTQASAAIPIVPLYITILYRTMKEKGLHEGCIEQMDRMMREKLYVAAPVVDEEGLIRMDDWEMSPEVQQEVAGAFTGINDDNLLQFADIDGYWQDFRQMFGFDFAAVDYDADVTL